MATPIEQLQRKAAVSSRWHGRESQETLTLRRELKEAKLAAYVERVVAEAPDLTDEQVNRIALLLRPRSGRDRA